MDLAKDRRENSVVGFHADLSSNRGARPVYGPVTLGMSLSLILPGTSFGSSIQGHEPRALQVCWNNGDYGDLALWGADSAIRGRAGWLKLSKSRNYREFCYGFQTCSLFDLNSAPNVSEHGVFPTQLASP